MRYAFLTMLSVFLCLSSSGCILAAAGAGAEAGYVLSQDDRTAKETVSDQILVSKVKSSLLADGEVSGLDINVDSFKGVISLKGVVSSENERDKALQIARSIEGVKDVKSKLFVE